MIIGVDAGALSIQDERLQVGVYKITKRFTEIIPHIDDSNYYRLYTFKRIGEWAGLEDSRRFEVRLVQPTIGWNTIGLPLELRRHPVDVFLGFSQTIPRQFFKKSYNIGFLYDLAFLRNPKFYPTSYNRLKYLTNTLVSRSHQIVTISHATRNDILAYYPDVPSDQITVCYPGIDDQFTSTGVSHVHPHPYFLYVGALKPGKNIPTLLRAFKTFLALQKKIYDLLLVGGDFWPDPLIDATITSLGLTDRVVKTGFISDSELPAYYRGAVGFVSLSPYEGFCMPAAESIACGVPVIGANTGAMPETVGDGGILVDPSDSESVARAMGEITNPKRRKIFIDTGSKHRKQFTWKSFVTNTYRVIQRAHNNE